VTEHFITQELLFYEHFTSTGKDHNSYFAAVTFWMKRQHPNP